VAKSEMPSLFWLLDLLGDDEGAHVSAAIMEGWHLSLSQFSDFTPSRHLAAYMPLASSLCLLSSSVIQNVFHLFSNYMVELEAPFSHEG
jgi:hypothetical protein